MSGKNNKKPQKLKARLPRGFADRSAADIRATDEMIARIREVYERYGFDPVETPMFEYTDALGKFLPDQDRPNEGVFSLQDDDEQWLSLRYDLTAPLARHVAENFQTLNLPYRTWRAGWVFRNEKPGPGRFRQFMQLDADTVGAPGVQADAEMCMMMADTMEALGIKRGDYVIRVNNRKVLDGVMEAMGILSPEQKLAVLRAIDTFDRLGADGVRERLGAGRLDESGDFVKGAGLSSAKVEYFLAIISRQQKVRAGGNDPEVKSINQALEKNAIYNSGFEELDGIETLARASGYGPDRIRIDPSVVRGLEYYTGPVYEADLLFDVVNEKGEKVRFGSVGGGGRYDGLVKRFTGQDVPATGFSIGLSRLMSALKNLGKLGQEAAVAPVLVTVMDSGRIGEYMAMAKKLREGLNQLGEDGRPLGPVIPVEMYQGNPKKFGKQLQYGDRRGCPLAIIQGSDERERGKVQIKDLIEGRRQAAAIESHEEWREERPGQFEIDEADLVSEVRRVLAEQAAGRAGAG